MKKVNALLVFLISSLAITGVSIIDGRIWDIIFFVIGMVSYTVVGILFSIGVLHGKKDGIEAYALFFFLLILGGYGIYRLLEIVRTWILSWPLWIKILVVVVVSLVIIVAIILIILYKKGKFRLTEIENNIE